MLYMEESLNVVFSTLLFLTLCFLGRPVGVITYLWYVSRMSNLNLQGSAVVLCECDGL